MNNIPSITEYDKLNVLTKLIPYNAPDDRISIEQLCLDLRISRRKLRAIVDAINMDESPNFACKMILTNTDDGGYWLAVPGADPAPALQNIASEMSRVTEILAKARAMEHKITRIYNRNQEALF